jgi:hypothetical protein
VTAHRRLFAPLALLLLDAACGAPPAPVEARAKAPALAASLGKRRTDIADDCVVEPGKPPPEPLRIQYAGVAKAARCQREVYTIMGGVTHFLGTECRHCHLEPDYAADTHNKQIANWMARELLPRLSKRVAEAGSKDVWCQDCHQGKAKFLGDPRRRDFAIEWMTTHMVDDFETVAGQPPKCKDCHGGDLGSPEFRSKVILSDLSGPPLPTPATPVPVPPPVVPPPAAAAASSSPVEVPSAPPPAPAIPNFGRR